MPTSARCRTPGGHDDPGVPRRSCPERGMVAGGDPQLSTPIFFLVSPKKKTAVEPSKEKTLFAAQLRARSALPRSGTRP